jgi:hypothetical protein
VGGQLKKFDLRKAVNHILDFFRTYDLMIRMKESSIKFAAVAVFLGLLIFIANRGGDACDPFDLAGGGRFLARPDSLNDEANHMGESSHTTPVNVRTMVGATARRRLGNFR